MKLNELSPLQRFLTISGFFLVLFVILLLLAEGALRLRLFLKSGQFSHIGDTFIIDPATELRIPKPGLNQGSITVNSKGFRGAEITQPKPDDTIRLAFLGGSTTYCAEVSGNEKVWPHIVTEKLRARFPNQSFDYINAGVPGYASEHSLTNLRTRVAEYSPDVIVIYHSTNDLSGNSFDAALATGVAESRADEGRMWISDYSLLAHLVELNLKIVSLQAKASEAGQVSKKLDISTVDLTTPFSNDMNALISEAKSVASVVAVATFATQFRDDQSNEQKISAAATSLYYMPYMTVAGLLKSFADYNDVIRNTAANQQAILIEAADNIPGDSDHFKDSVHFTDAGSAAMADQIFDRLKAEPKLLKLINQ